MTVKTKKARYVSKSIVLCCGPWSSRVLSDLGICHPLTVCYFFPDNILLLLHYQRVNMDKSCGLDSFFLLQTVAVQVCYWKMKPGYDNLQIPGFVHLDTLVYGLPSAEYPGLFKVLCSGSHVILLVISSMLFSSSLTDLLFCNAIWRLHLVHRLGSTVAHRANQIQETTLIKTRRRNSCNNWNCLLLTNFHNWCRSL